jgi:hypothetical protein
MNQKVAQVLTGISPNTLRVCSMNHHVRELEPRKLELFDPVAQEWTSFNL